MPRWATPFAILLCAIMAAINRCAALLPHTAVKRPAMPLQTMLSLRQDHDDSETDESSLPTAGTLYKRNRFLQALGAGMATAHGATLSPSQAHAASTTNAFQSITTTPLLADLPMVRIRVPQGALGREYIGIQLKVNGQGPFDFMLDSGLTTELITPHLQQILHIHSGQQRIAGLAAGGSTMSSSIVSLSDVALCCGKLANGQSELPLPALTAVVTNFPQEHLDPAHDPVEGMLGMELLSMFDVEFDFRNHRIKFWQPGTAISNVGGSNKFVEIPAVVINETGLIGIRVTAPGGAANQQPILGFIDCGATFSAVNWAGAQLLGLPAQGDRSYARAPQVSAVGVDGRPLQLPTVQQQLTFVGDAQQDNGKLTGFMPPPKQWKAWKPVTLAVGDLPAFSTVLGDGQRPYQGPAALIGLDVLAQRRIVLETGPPNRRRRKLWVEPN